MSDPTPMAELVEQVKKHAVEHYEDGGWDVVVECFTDAEIAEVLGPDARVGGAEGASTFEEALAKFVPLIDVWSDRQADARNSAF